MKRRVEMRNHFYTPCFMKVSNCYLVLSLKIGVDFMYEMQYE